MELDETDMRIIDVLRENSKLSSQKISKKTGIPITTIHNRIKKLEKEGVISKYTIILDEKKLGNKVTAYVLVYYNIVESSKVKDFDTLKKPLLSLPYIKEIKYIGGRYDILLKVVAPSLEAINDLLLRKLRKIPGIGRTETFFVIEELR